MSEKKSKRLTIEERVQLLHRLESGETASFLASSYGITKAAVTSIKKNKENLLEQKRLMEEAGGNAAKRKKWTGIEETELEKVLYRWFVQRRAIGDPISGPLLQEKARLFNEMLDGSTSFVASDGFLHKFKKRHNIRHLSIQGEKLSADSKASEAFGEKIREYLQDNGFDMDHVYNADETGLYWKMLPNKTLVATNESSAAGRKTAKDRVTIMVCTNASGTHKIPLMVIGKSARPRCFKNIKILPTIYKGQKSAWMDRSLMQEWYTEVFLPEIEKFHGATGQKCILLLDNAPSHPSVETFNALSDMCEVKFMPPNVTSLIQPMDQGIIEKLKRVYRKNLLRLALTEDTFQGVETVLKSLTMLSCCNFVAFAWNEVTEQNIRNAWKNLFPTNFEAASPDYSLEADAYLNIARRLPHLNDLTLEDTKRWFDIDRDEPGWRVISDQELVTGIEPEEIEELKEDELEFHSTENLEPDQSPKDALRGLDNFLRWYQTRWECTPEHLQLLNELKSLAITQIVEEKTVERL